MNENNGKEMILRYTALAFRRELGQINPDQDQEQARLRSELAAEGLSHKQIIRLAAEVFLKTFCF